MFFLSSILQLHLPLTTPLPGSELTKEPFRWDQRLFSLVLRIPGNASVEPEPLGGVPPDDSPITPMCEVTGGKAQDWVQVGCFFGGGDIYVFEVGIAGI